MNPSNGATKATATATEVRSGLPVLAFATAALFERWLSLQPANSKGLWLKLAKKDSGVSSVSKQQAIESALCHGWIDGQLNPYDDRFWLVRFAPRSSRSAWSEINRSTAARLLTEGRLMPAGKAQIEAAQADGRWQGAYAPASRATVPPDLAAALAANMEARRFFDQLTGANRYAVLYRVQQAKTADTRARRIEKFVAMLERHEVLHPSKSKGD